MIIKQILDLPTKRSRKRVAWFCGEAIRLTSLKTLYYSTGMRHNRALFVCSSSSSSIWNAEELDCVEKFLNNNGICGKILERNRGLYYYIDKIEGVNFD